MPGVGVHESLGIGSCAGIVPRPPCRLLPIPVGVTHLLYLREIWVCTSVPLHCVATENFYWRGKHLDQIVSFTKGQWLTSIHVLFEKARLYVSAYEHNVYGRIPKLLP